MERNLFGRLMALCLGVIAGLAVTMVVIPVRMENAWLLVDRMGYACGRLPRVGDLVLVDNVVFTEAGEGGRVVRRICAVDGDLVYVLCDEDQRGLDSRSEAVGPIPKDQIRGRVVYERKENSHGTEKAPGEQ